MKRQYISLMEKALSGYTDRHISDYFEAVKTKGLTEHGFPRLTADIGIMISHGIRADLLPLFCEMMEFCCQNIPKVKAANDFSVREIICCIMALEKTQTVDTETTDRWKQYLKAIVPQSCYTVYAKNPSDEVYNWACFTMLSEYMRQYVGLCDSTDFVELQISSQLRLFDENGMYRDPNQPMVYDLVTRGIFSLLLHFGYRGKFYGQIDAVLKKAGLYTLKMQSVTGEIPYGGRSNQFLFNEALPAIIFEYEAKRYAGEGDLHLAQKFKSATDLALKNTAYWLDQKPIRHIKNRFETENGYGCEKYAYFDKYMITTASYLYSAYLICDDTIPSEKIPERLPEVFQTSEDFHKLFLTNEPYSLEFDISADHHYDVSGLGRLHRSGAPSAICLSLPCTSAPNYVIDLENATDLSLCPGILIDGKWNFATDDTTKYTVTGLSESNQSASVELVCSFSDRENVQTEYTVDKSGTNIEIRGNGDIAYLLPAFSFDGENLSEITFDDHTLAVSYSGWTCRYTTDGNISDSGRTACNRNGHYRVFFATSQNILHLNISIEPTDNHVGSTSDR
ncbi:MAG: hypothetical protein ACI3XQ_01065 [Eubacteriales bacterium]